MNYKSTRNSNISITSKEAIAKGISDEGGLFVPETFPQYTCDDIIKLQALNYKERATFILNEFLGDFTESEINDSISKAYTEEKFGADNPAPVKPVIYKNTNIHMLELWHGPTCAFKDMALQILPQLLTYSMQAVNSGKTAIVLVATSGDTGKAALEGFKNVNETKVIVFYPEYGVSNMQKLQMITQEGNNVYVCAIAGNFDDAQTAVKKIFTDEENIKILDQNNMMFSSANSINWGRLLPQIVYYFSAYCDMLGNGTLTSPKQGINVCVPTGNFGNILAAYYAKKMGLPIKKLICASNFNNVLTDFINTGVYNKNRHFYSTNSPSMDILISSNLERLLYDITGEDSNEVQNLMNQLNDSGRYAVSDKVKEEIQQMFFAACCDDKDTKATIKDMFNSSDYLCDTHTAVAVNAYRQYVNDTQDTDTPTLIVSTASPYKFAPEVLDAITNEKFNDEFECIKKLSEISGTEIPNPIKELRKKNIVFNNSIQINDMNKFVLGTLNI